MQSLEPKRQQMIKRARFRTGLDGSKRLRSNYRTKTETALNNQGTRPEDALVITC